MFDDSSIWWEILNFESIILAEYSDLCPSGMFMYNSQLNQCYLFEPTSLNYEKSVEFCEQNNATLAYISSEEELSFLQRKLQIFKN